ncbi:cytochrome P450 [Streptomyces yangpuensis]|uniref:cytochrome P450 n=1 Tax=Streptomyces yangpuensis TaxID=1648182 RepID=UPI0036290D23
MGAANRDPDACGDPDTFDIHRTDLGTARSFTAAAQHMAFGTGLHRCVGAAFARYLRILREAPEERVWTVTDDLFHLFREGETLSRLRTWSREDEMHDRPLRPEDLDVVLRMAAETEGPASAELVRYWRGADPRPSASTVSWARAGSPPSRPASSWPAPPDPEDLATDPVVAAAWRYTGLTAPVSPGEHIGISRSAVSRTASRQASTAPGSPTPPPRPDVRPANASGAVQIALNGP